MQLPPVIDPYRLGSTVTLTLAQSRLAGKLVMLLSTRHVLRILIFLSLKLTRITYARRYFGITGSSPLALVPDSGRPTLRPAAATCCFSYCNNSRRRYQIFRRISATMGPIHASKSASRKMEGIRSILRDHHGVASPDGLQVNADSRLIGAPYTPTICE